MYSENRVRPVRSGAKAAMRTVAVFALALTCSGCMFAATKDVSTVPLDYRLRHPIAIKEANKSLEVFIGSRRGSLTPVQRAEVAGFASSWKREATGGIIVDVPAGTPNGHAAHDSVREIRSILAAHGVKPGAMNVRSYTPENPARLATVRLTYPRMAAQAGPCGLWPEDLGPTTDPKNNRNEPHWNHGCATQRSLAAMVAEPADLVQPRGEGPVHAARRTTVLEKYRLGTSTATQYPNADKGAISDIGK
jgi:pilus assembly protein CpaD